jgi:hypothetical protein
MFENLISGINHYIEVYGQDPLFWLSWGFFLYFCSVFVYTILRKLFIKKTMSQEVLKDIPTEPIVSLSELKPKRSKTDDIDYGRLSGEDVIATKLDLAHAYIEAKDLLKNI